AFSKYEYEHPKKPHAAPVVAPAIGSVQYAALGVDDCGTALPYLQTDTSYKGGGFLVGGDDVIRLSPLTAADAGHNANLKTFASEYAGLKLTSSELAVPKADGVANPKTTFKNGEDCAAGTKYAGKPGKVVYAYWTTLAQKSPTLTTNPAKIHFDKDLRVTLAFVPAGVTPTPPAQKSVDEMVLDATTPTTTTTTTLPTTTTTAPLSTTTTAPTTTTTKG
ncbi:MAG TPA: hypothetical protein VMF33_04865, partial [Acidimicrobiales bacterium]|nr:hypothetical protein [Acidimicrobiales bacterium]